MTSGGADVLKVQYPPERQALLAGLGAEVLKDFALTVPVAKLKGILHRLPRVTGFRPGRDVPVRLIAFFGKITRWTEQDWETMGELWSLWTSLHTDLVKVLGAGTKDAWEKRVVEICSDADKRRTIFMGLAIAARDGGFTRETLQSWYQFGPIPVDPDIEWIVTLVPTRGEMVLLSRVTTLEGKLLALEKHQLDLGSHITAVQQKFVQTNEQVEALSDIPSQLANLKNIVSDTSGVVTAMESSLGRLASLVETQRLEVSHVRTELEDTHGQLSSLIAGQSDNHSTLLSHSDLLAQLSEAQSQGQQDAAELRDGIQLLVQEQLEIKELAGTKISEPVSSLVPLAVSRGMQGTSSQSLVVQKVEVVGGGALLDDTRGAVVQLTQNLNDLGIIRPHAGLTAHDVLTGLLAGQLVSFDGSMAAIVAERCAVSLAEEVYRVRIPVGLIEPRFFEDLLFDVTQRLSDHVVAVIIEGANRSAIEVYGSALHRLIAERCLRMASGDMGLLLFATLVDGPASLPDRKGFAELGPILDTDAFTWMERIASKSSPGTFLRKAWDQSCHIQTIDSDWRGLIGPEEIIRNGGVLWHRTLMLAMHFKARLMTDSESSLEQAASGLSFGWLIPMLMVLAPEGLKQSLEHLRLDDRAKNLLERVAPDMVRT